MSSQSSRNILRYTIGIGILFLVVGPMFYFLTKWFYAEDMEDIIVSVQQTGHLPAEIDLERDVMIGMGLQFVLIFIVLIVSSVIMLWAIRRQQKNQVIQREFTENASHELQTPLAILRAKIDLLMQQPLDDKSMGIVAEMNDTVSSITRLNHSLLMLSKIENRQYKDKTAIRLSDYIKEAISRFQSLRDDVTFTFNDNSTYPVEIEANNPLFESLMNNLVSNAICNTHSGNKSITITLSDHSVCVANPSNGTPLNAERIFERFHSTSDTQNGHGLGLAIAQSICDYHGWQLTYQHRNDQHTFTIMLQ